MGAFNKHRNILDFTLTSLRRRKGNLLAVGVVYTFVVFLLASAVLFTSAIKKEAALLLAKAPEVTVQRLEAGRQVTIPRRYIEEISTIKGVQKVRPRLWGYYFDTLTRANYTVMVNEELDDRPGEIIVGSGVLAGSEEKGTVRPAIGDSIPFRTYTGEALVLTIRSILPFASELEAADLILVSEPDFRRLFAMAPEQYTDLVLTVRNAKEMPTIAAKIVQLHPDTRPVLREDILKTYDAIFDWRGGLVILTLTAALLAFVILVWDKATGLSAEEKREIGLLKALGWDTADILLVKFWEGAAVSLSSFTLGLLLAYLHVFLGSAFVFMPVLKGWSVLYPHFRLTPHMDPYQIAVLFFLAVVPFSVATIIPSWRSATIDPDAVMRT